jgi:hypothetical protein
MEETLLGVIGQNLLPFISSKSTPQVTVARSRHDGRRVL